MEVLIKFINQPPGVKPVRNTPAASRLITIEQAPVAGTQSAF